MIAAKAAHSRKMPVVSSTEPDAAVESATASAGKASVYPPLSARYRQEPRHFDGSMLILCIGLTYNIFFKNCIVELDISLQHRKLACYFQQLVN